MEQIIKALEADIRKLQELFISNGLLLNETKCQLLVIEPSKYIRDDLAEVQVCGKTIFESTHGKPLGNTIARYQHERSHNKSI